MDTDLQRARDIVRAYRDAGFSILSSGVSLDERVATLVAEGIALGRQEALHGGRTPNQ